MVQASEVFELLGAVILLPLIWRSLAALRLAGRELLRGALIAILFGYVATIAEGFIAFAFFNAVEHGAYAVAGIMFALFGVSWLRRVEAGGMMRP